jgi:hypothetical protein
MSFTRPCLHLRIVSLDNAAADLAMLARTATRELAEKTLIDGDSVQKHYE